MDPLLIVVIVLAVLLACCFCCMYRECTYGNFRQPSPRPLPLAGDLLFMKAGNTGEKIRKWVEPRELGVLGMQFGSRPVVVACDWQSMRDANMDEFNSRPTIFQMNNLWFDGAKSTKTAQQPQWYDYRTFLVTSLARYKQKHGHDKLLDGEIGHMMESFRKKVSKGAPYRPLDDIRFHVMNFSNILCFDKRWDASEDEAWEVHDCHKYFVNEFNKGEPSDWITWLKTPTARLQSVAERKKVYRAYYDPQFDEHLKNFEDNKEEKDDRDDLVDIMLKLRSEEERYEFLTDENVYISAIVDMHTGITPGMCRLMEWLLVFLCNYPKWLPILREEIEKVCGDRRPLLADLESLPTVRAFIMEAHRYIPVVIWTIPHQSSRKGTVCGYPVEKDQIVLHNLYAIHHRERYWPNHTQFDPSRFIDSKIEEEENFKYKFVPFGVGPRMCPGASFANEALSVFLCNVIYNFDIPEQYIDEEGFGQPIGCLYKNCEGIKMSCRDVKVGGGGDEEEPDDV